jgi:glycosyltransferase involved in cell wall biosynthesis
MFKLLLLGPLPTKSNQLITGGAIVLFSDLLDQLCKCQIQFEVIDTNKRNYSNSFLAVISITFKIIIKSFKVDHISLHSSRDYIYLGILVILIAKIYNKKTSLRKFGGQLISTIGNQYTSNEKKIIELIKKFDYLFVETKELTNYFNSIRTNTYWFPNVRPRVAETYIKKEYTKKFVFISHIIRDKGVGEILEASRNFDESYSFHFYGQFSNSDFKVSDFSSINVSYRGMLKKEEVISAMRQYDVVLLPSYKEGYPGIIIEAYSVGLPIIATNLSSISEICKDGIHGKLVNPKNITELISAIDYINKENYSFMAKNCFDAFKQFESKPNTEKFINIIQNKN